MVLIILLLFLVSVAITMTASAWFTRRLEAICVRLALPISLLSLLGALAANIPNYAASIDAIANGQADVGLGIIIGSNIYNVAIILAVSTFAAPRARGIVLPFSEIGDIDVVGLFSLIIMLATGLLAWLLPGTPLLSSHTSLVAGKLYDAAIVLALGIFAALVYHALRRVHTTHRPSEHTSPETQAHTARENILAHRPLARLVIEAAVGLAVALGGVAAMVRAGETLTGDLHMPPVLAGLLILAVATSLPNTVVAFSLARDGRASACIEEIFSSNSINATFGIALPLLLWPAVLHDRLLLFMDAPLMAALTLSMLLLTLRRRIGHPAAVLLVATYMAWVIVHMLI